MASIKKGVLFGIGNPLLDISTNCGKGYLDKYGMKENDAILAKEEHMSMYSEMENMFSVDYIPGGSTQNSIKVAQWMLGEKEATTFIGCIGEDKYGDILKEKTEEIGVKTSYYKQNKEPTGLCAVLVCGLNRSMCANLAAANEYKLDHLKLEENWKLVNEANFFYIAGFFLTASAESALEIAKHAAETGKCLALNLSAPFLSQFFMKQLMEIIPYCDIIFGNETEAATFSECSKFDTKDIGEIAQKIAKLPKVNSNRPRMVVITQGSENTCIAGQHDVKYYPVIPLESCKIADTNGAGDAFVGGFLSQLVQNKSTEECVEGGNWAANLVIQRSGCTFPEKCDFKK